MTDSAEITLMLITLLPIIVFILIFRWIIHFFSNIDFDSRKSKSSLFSRRHLTEDEDDDDLEELRKNKLKSITTRKRTVDEVLVSCEKCGASNKELEAYCGHCGSHLYGNEIVKVSPVRIDTPLNYQNHDCEE